MIRAVYSAPDPFLNDPSRVGVFLIYGLRRKVITVAPKDIVLGRN